MQLRFLIAEAIFKRYKQELTADERLKRAFSTLNNAIFQPMGLVAADGSVSLEFDLLIVKLKQELKLSDKARKHFRELGENNRSLLQDLQEALTGRIEEHLSRQENRPGSIAPGLVDPEAIRLAAIHSGGALRDFFRLLRAGVDLADFNSLDKPGRLAVPANLRQSPCIRGGRGAASQGHRQRR